MKLSDLDKNFAPEELNRDDTVFYDARKTPFAIYGLYHPQTEAEFRRMPDTAAARVSIGVRELAKNTAGGRIRFKTDSSFIAIRADMPPFFPMDNMPLLAQSFGLYINRGGESTYFGSFRYNFDKMMQGEGITSILNLPPLPDGEVRDITVYFPLYASVKNLWIGLENGAKLLPGDTYRREKPVVFYGSSITQGGCASHPGNSYQGFLSRRFDFDYINLGFSGNAKGEDAMAAYIAALDMSMFVYDYDHNAPTLEHLRSTHEKLFRTVRAAHPDIPIIFMTAPNFDGASEGRALRRNLIFENYTRAFSEGDRNLFFVDGERMFGGDCRDACTVDGCHPNDLGFYRMADAVGAVMKCIYTHEK